MHYRLGKNDAGIIESRPMDHSEKFINGDGSRLLGKTVLDYWIWAFSDLVGNTERGGLAEYLVAMAIGAESPLRNSWHTYDIDALDGTKIEVKSALYLNARHQKQLSKIRFNIRKTLEWIPKKNVFAGEKKRRSDIYVFCLLTQKQESQLNPLNLEQWEFYVIPTAVLDREFDDKQNITLYQIRKHSQEYKFNQLRDAISRVGLDLALKELVGF